MRFLSALLCLFTLALPALAATEGEADSLFSQIQMGDVEAVEDTLTQDAKRARLRDRFGFEPIHVLDYTNFEEMLGLLIAHGADINATNDAGHTLLHILIDPEFIAPVLAAGADIEARDAEGRTPLLLWLTEAESADMIEALLDAGANPNARDAQGRSALDYAQDPELARLLQAHGAT